MICQKGKQISMNKKIVVIIYCRSDRDHSNWTRSIYFKTSNWRPIELFDNLHEKRKLLGTGRSEFFQQRKISIKQIRASMPIGGCGSILFIC